MSRGPMADARSWWAGLAERTGAAYREFREGRLFVQMMLTLVMVSLAGLVSRFPAGPLARVHEGLTWTVTHDYDFAGQATAARAWAEARGGWKAALTGLWETGAGRAREWAAPFAQGREAPSEAAAADDMAEPAAEEAGAPEAEAAAPAVAGTWAMPVQGSVMNPFGWHNGGEQERYHNGVDILALRGAPVVAVAEGKVVRVDREELLGQVVEVEHGDLLVLYAQLEGVRVKAGDRVRQGDQIGAVGNPVGDHRHLSPHLHLEVRPRGSKNPVNPIPYLPLGGREI